MANDLIAFFALRFFSFSVTLAVAVVMYSMLEGITADFTTMSHVSIVMVMGFIAFALTISTVLEVVRSALKAVLVYLLQVTGAIDVIVIFSRSWPAISTFSLR